MISGLTNFWPWPQVRCLGVTLLGRLTKRVEINLCEKDCGGETDRHDHDDGCSDRLGYLVHRLHWP